MGQPLEGVVLAKVLGLALRDRMARPGRARVPEPMVMDDPGGVRVFHESAMDVQLPVYEFNASSMSRLVPEGGSVLDLGRARASSQRTSSPGVPTSPFDASTCPSPWWTPDDARRLSGGWTALGSSSGTSPRSTRRSSAHRTSSAARGCFTSFRTGRPSWRHCGRSRRSASSTAARCGSTTWPGFGARRPCRRCSTCSTRRGPPAQGRRAGQRGSRLDRGGADGVLGRGRAHGPDVVPGPAPRTAPRVVGARPRRTPGAGRVDVTADASRGQEDGGPPRPRHGRGALSRGRRAVSGR